MMESSSAAPQSVPANLDAAAPVVPGAAVAIAVRSVSFFYGQKQALTDISIDIHANRVTAFIGPSGCGKSTFLRALNRMNDVIPGARLTGSVRIGGEDIYAPTADVVKLRRQVGMVFQKSNPFPKSIFENVAYGLRVNGLAGTRRELANRVEESLQHAAIWDEVKDRLHSSALGLSGASGTDTSFSAARTAGAGGINGKTLSFTSFNGGTGDEVKDRLHSSALGLSGGQQQRLCIARALATRPAILLMDEPASALDPIATQRIEELVYQLKKDYTIVIVTHNMQQAARVSDTTAFFWLGKLLEYGPTEKVFTAPAQKLTEDYVTGRFG